MAIAWPERGSDIEATAGRVQAWALARFEYVRDEDLWAGDPNMIFGDHWETDAEINRDLGSVTGIVYGDCDTFAKLCWLALRSFGESARLVFCKTELGEGHLVCALQGWVLDNRQPIASTRDELERLGYTWISMSGFQPGGAWTEIKQ